MPCPSSTAILQLLPRGRSLLRTVLQDLRDLSVGQPDRLERPARRLLDQLDRLVFEVLDRPDLLARKGLLARLG